MIKHSLKITLGFVLVFIGIIGGLIPIFQGWVFGVPGLIILAEYFPPLKKIVDWAKKNTQVKKLAKSYTNLFSYKIISVFNFSLFWIQSFLV